MPGCDRDAGQQVNNNGEGFAYSPHGTGGVRIVAGRILFFGDDLSRGSIARKDRGNDILNVFPVPDGNGDELNMTMVSYVKKKS